MKASILVTMLCCTLTLATFPAMAADGSNETVSAKALSAAKKKSMAEKGSYHLIHKKAEKLECEDCHETGPLPDSTLKLRLHEPLAKGSPGPVTADACHECHGKKQKKQITWYAPKSPSAPK